MMHRLEMTLPIVKAMSDAELWLAADARATELQRVLHDDWQREQDIEGMPYWFFVGMCVGVLTTITRELASRAPQENGH